jgi:adenosylcobinamide kinase/adenosylcobinamide-phosphate guanylyltransferase
VSQGFCVLAGHVRPGDSRSSVDWVALARSGITLVLLMSIDHLTEIADTLISAGLGGGTPGAVVSDGWSRQQRVVTAPLRDLASAVRAAGVTNPAVVVIGDVAELAASELGIPGALLPSAPASPAGSPPPGADGGPGSEAPPAEPGHGASAHADPGPTSLAGAASTQPAGAAPGPLTGAAPTPPAGAAPAPLTGAAPSSLTGAVPSSLTEAAHSPVAGAAPSPRPSSGAGPSLSSFTSATGRTGWRVLVLGGARSGKSATAEDMLAGDAPVDYVATGITPGSGDAEWDARVAEHKERRPPNWRTVETLALAEVLAAPDTAPVLVDCLTTWLAQVMDECGAWDDVDGTAWALAERIEQMLQAWRHTRRQVIAVSNEIGSGVVPDTASGRRFRDELGRLNARIAADSDEVWLCTAGIARRLR